MDTWFRCVSSPCHLEDPQQADAAQHRDAQRRHDLQLHQDGLHDAAAHHEAVEAVKERHEIMSQSQTVHLQQHLHGEQRQQHLVGDVCRDTRSPVGQVMDEQQDGIVKTLHVRVLTLDLCQPLRLVVVLGGAEGGVEEDEQENQPIECHRFDGGATVSATDSIPATQRPTEREESQCGDVS